MKNLQRRLDQLEQHAWPKQARYVFVHVDDPGRQEQIDAARAALRTGEALHTITITGGFKAVGGAL